MLPELFVVLIALALVAFGAIAGFAAGFRAGVTHHATGRRDRYGLTTRPMDPIQLPAGVFAYLPPGRLKPGDLSRAAARYYEAHPEDTSGPTGQAT